jgi:hypothetical protein
MRDRAGLTELHLGMAWDAEQMTSQERQPLHLSASIRMVLTFLVTLAI